MFILLSLYLLLTLVLIKSYYVFRAKKIFWFDDIDFPIPIVFYLPIFSSNAQNTN